MAKKTGKNRSKEEKLHLGTDLFCSDGHVAFIVGYTSGGAAFGLAHWEMDVPDEEVKEDEGFIPRFQHEISNHSMINDLNQALREDEYSILEKQLND
ncbi:MAG: hypothetical protein JWQ40_3760 [Segetibacter sp.]|nr:hypothetical protein [Segetibacter sp.]